MVIENKFEIKDTVYLVTDKDQNPGIVTSIKIFSGGELLYIISMGKAWSEHYDFELSYEKNILITTE